MSPRLKAREHRCNRCCKGFTSWRRLQHHWVAEHAPRTSEDIARTSAHVAKTRNAVPTIYGIPPIG